MDIEHVIDDVLSNCIPYLLIVKVVVSHAGSEQLLLQLEDGRLLSAETPLLRLLEFPSTKITFI